MVTSGIKIKNPDFFLQSDGADLSLFRIIYSLE